LRTRLLLGRGAPNGHVREINTMRTTWAIAFLAAATITHGAQAQDAAAGQAVFGQCRICHQIGPTAKNFAGPELNGLDGRKAGSVPGFSYSAANKNSGIVWNHESFEAYIKDPRGKVPGTKMSFPGIKNKKDIDNLWAYLSQFGPDGKKK
jgi:cytochrome c